MACVNPNTALAAEYARCGVKVFPCREADIGLRKAKSPYTRTGYLEASADPLVLHNWATMHPAAIYGLPCAPNGLFVLDADRHGEADGVQSLMAVFAHHKFDLGTVPAIRTPRDGLHVIFARPEGVGRTKGSISRAVDVRDNGYIIAPGAILPDGRQYQLLNGTTQALGQAIANRTLLPMPAWLMALACHPTDTISKPIVNLPQTDLSGNLAAGLISAVLKASVGNRNAVLYWASCRAGELAAQLDVDRGSLAALLGYAGVFRGLEKQEARRTVESGMKTGMAGDRHAK